MYMLITSMTCMVRGCWHYSLISICNNQSTNQPMSMDTLWISLSLDQNVRWEISELSLQASRITGSYRSPSHSTMSGQSIQSSQLVGGRISIETNSERPWCRVRCVVILPRWRTNRLKIFSISTTDLSVISSTDSCPSGKFGVEINQILRGSTNLVEKRDEQHVDWRRSFGEVAESKTGQYGQHH